MRVTFVSPDSALAFQLLLSTCRRRGPYRQSHRDRVTVTLLDLLATQAGSQLACVGSAAVQLNTSLQYVGYGEAGRCRGAGAWHPQPAPSSSASAMMSGYQRADISYVIDIRGIFVRYQSHYSMMSPLISWVIDIRTLFIWYVYDILDKITRQ